MKTNRLPDPKVDELLEYFYKDKSFSQMWTDVTMNEKEKIRARFFTILQEQFIVIKGIDWPDRSEYGFWAYLLELALGGNENKIKHHLVNKHKLLWWNYNTVERKMQMAFSNVIYIGDIYCRH